MSTVPKTSTLSIIIPCLNDGPALAVTLENLKDGDNLEIVVADGGSVDDSAAVGEAAGAKLVHAPRGRGQQLNAGAAAAGGGIFFFLHADTTPPPGFADIIRATLKRKGVAAGSFSLGLDINDWRARLICRGANLRSRIFSLPYGDQGIFLSRKTFNDINGFPEQEIMEDFEFIRRMKKQGRIIIRPERVASSGRRWQRLGFFRTTLINQMMIAGYLLGRSPASLARRYRKSLNSRE